jgi:hypothetical protein
MRVFQVILLDLAISLFFGLLVVEKESRWPILLMIVPLLLFFNIKRLRGTQGTGRRASMTLPLLYGAGVVFAVVWAILNFEWWKLLIVPVPLSLMIYFLLRTKHRAQDEAV